MFKKIIKFYFCIQILFCLFMLLFAYSAYGASIYMTIKSLTDYEIRGPIALYCVIRNGIIYLATMYICIKAPLSIINILRNDSNCTYDIIINFVFFLYFLSFRNFWMVQFLYMAFT